MRPFCTLLTLVLGAVFAEEAPAQNATTNGSLTSFFASQGFAGAPMKRRFGNHIFLPVAINGHRAALMVDTGAPMTIVDRSSVGTLGLKVENTNAHVGRIFGLSYDRYGVGELGTLAMGNCIVTHVPVAVADQADMNYYSRLEHLDGLFGAHEMRKFGVVIDCARQMLYVSPAGPNASVSSKLRALLTSRGFEAIPMRLNGNSHFEAEASINGKPTRLIVDTGSSTTLLSKQLAAAAGVPVVPMRMGVETDNGYMQRLSTGVVKDLGVGSFHIADAEVALGDVSKKMLRADVESEASAGLLGIEHLSLNFGIVDVGGMTLYLRHPDKR